ncbi:MAG: dienelactone hydrolase family protein [Myxococcota bacterium]|nr:dienelactone hydrolase family protein [Myxococcota bacterium]
MPQSEQLMIPTSGGNIPFHRYAPAAPGPLLVIIPSIYGVTSDVVFFAKCFAADGALVYAIDPFWRTAPGPLHIPNDTEPALCRKRETTLVNATSDLVATIDAGRSDPSCNGTAIALGICFGGQPVLRAAKERHLHGVAVWHGAGLLSVLDEHSLRDTRISFDFGEADPLIPLSEVNAIATVLPKHVANIRTHPNAGHGFSHVGTAKCDELAANRAQRGVTELIKVLTER